MFMMFLIKLDLLYITPFNVVLHCLINLNINWDNSDVDHELLVNHKLTLNNI
ncbi:unnamed protein product, partial [Rotaria sordida]